MVKNLYGKACTCLSIAKLFLLNKTFYAKKKKIGPDIVQVKDKFPTKFYKTYSTFNEIVYKFRNICYTKNILSIVCERSNKD